MATAAIFLYQNQKNEEYKNFEETWDMGMNMDARKIGEYLSKNDVSVSEEKLEQHKEQMQLWLSQSKEQRTEKIRKILRKHGIESADLEDGINKLYEISEKGVSNDSEITYDLIDASMNLYLMEIIEKAVENDSSLSSIQSSTIFIAFFMANNGVEATDITVKAFQKLRSCMSETTNNTFFCINEVSESIENISEGFIAESSLAEVDDCSKSLILKKSNNLVQDLSKRLESTKNPYLKFFRSLNHNVYNYCGKNSLEKIMNNEDYKCYEPEDYNRYRSAMVTIAASSPLVSCVVNQTIQKTEGISLEND